MLLQGQAISSESQEVEEPSHLNFTLNDDENYDDEPRLFVNGEENPVRALGFADDSGAVDAGILLDVEGPQMAHCADGGEAIGAVAL